MRRIDGAAVSAGGASSAYAGTASTGNTFRFDPSTAASVTASSHPPASASPPAPTTSSLDLGGVGFGRNTALSGRAGGGGGGGGGALYTSSVGGGEAARAAMGWGATSGSKAVLSALRALQDKIRNLESERDRASVEAGTLRRQIEALQTENDRTAQTITAGVQEKSLASRLAYERLQADKVAADVRLRKAEEQKRLFAREAEASKERSIVAETAREAGESRIRILEDRLLELGRQEEKGNSAESGAAEEAARRTGEKSDQVEELWNRVSRMETSISAEKAMRTEAEASLARALSAKGNLERFLEGVLRVNEELVKAAGGGTGGTKRKKYRRPKVVAAPAAAGGEGGNARAAAASSAGGGRSRGSGGGSGGGVVENFNVGTHTAKRASARARKLRQAKRAAAAVVAVAAAAPTADVPNAPQSGMLGQAAPRARRQQRIPLPSKGVKRATKGRGVRSAAAAVAGARGGGARTVPFVGSGSGLGQESYNVVSAVSKAVRTARRGRPRESLDTLYAEVGNAVVNSTNEVPFMCQGRRGSVTEPSLRSSAPVVTAMRSARRGADRAGRRAVLDVAMPDLRSLNLGSSDTPRHLQGGNDSVESREFWSRGWDGDEQSVGQEEQEEQQEKGERRGATSRSWEGGTGGGGEREERGGGGIGGGREAGDAEIGRAEGGDKKHGERYGGHSSDESYGAGAEEDDEEEEEEEEGAGGADEGGGRGGYDSRDAGGQEDSLPDQHGMGVSGLPSTDGSLSSGDERVWRTGGHPT